MPKQKHDPAWERKLSFLPPRKKAIFDGTCPDVTDKEVQFLYQDLKRRRLDDCARHLDELYPDALFKDAKAAIRKAGFDPAKLKIERTILGTRIDGLTLQQWLLVNDPSYQPSSLKSFSQILTAMKKDGKKDLVKHVEEKYRSFIDECNNSNLIIKGVNPKNHDGQHKYYRGKIDGIPVGLWKALHDPEYIPQVTHLKAWMKRLEVDGEDDKVILLMDKYESLLCKDEPEPELSLEEADDYFKNLLGPNYTRK